MAKNVMKLLKPSPHRARNDFDLSHRHLFDANFGELLPCTCIETVPGDNITLHASDLIRNIPLTTSMFLRAKQHIDVWFVPYRDLWHNFDAFITKKSEPVSSAYQQLATYLPNMKVKDLMYYINNLSSSPYNLKDVVGRPLSDRSYYLLELLGYGHLNDPNVDMTKDYSVVNPFRLAAYNYIWYNEYRQQYYDDGKLNQGASTLNVARLFNFDDLDCSTQAGANVFNTSDQYYSYRLASMCQMRYRTWKKDLFTGLLPSTQFGAVSTVTLPQQYIVSSNTSFTTNFASVTTRQTNIGSTQNVIQMNDGTNGTSLIARENSFDVLAFRKSEAIQIWRENALRAGNHIKDNMMAHFGVASDFQDHRPTFLGSVSAPVNISDVVATASTGAGGGNDTLGDIAGKGLSSLSEKVFKFHAKEFGVIMCMFSVLPEGEYEADGIERTNQLLEAEDFFMPEYENLGLEAVSSVNFGAASSALYLNYIKVVGYAPRYYAYKTKLDKVFGEFCGTGVFRPWACQRNDLTNYFSQAWSNMPLSLLYVNPKVFNGHFVLDVDNSPQFMCDIYFDVDAVRPMSVMGLPFS